MDYEDIIKLQQQSPIYSTGNNSFSLKNCMASFYDNDSEIQKRMHQDQDKFQNYYSFEQAIDYIQKFVDITDMPLQEVMLYFDKINFNQHLDKNILRKKILKRKNILKRYRAKNRMPKYIMNIPQIYPFSQQNALETQSQIKKKRNRVSAQISRDRKKQYFKELQQKNLKLEQQMLKTKIENQQLKKQIINKNNFSNGKNNNFSESFNNKLTRLLIFLGIICLISMLKDTFFTAGQNLTQFKYPQKIHNFGSFSTTVDQLNIVEQGKRKVAQFLEQGQIQKQFTLRNKKNFNVTQINYNEKNSKKFIFFSSLIQKLETMKQSLYEHSY